MSKLIFSYTYNNEYNRRKDFQVEVTGETREKLVENLINKRDVVSIYYFLKFFPDLSDDIKEKLKVLICEIQGISTNTAKIEDYINFPEKIYLLTHSNVYFQSETKESLYYLHY